MEKSGTEKVIQMLVESIKGQLDCHTLSLCLVTKIVRHYVCALHICTHAHTHTHINIKHLFFHSWLTVK